jgi:hypothetical protein
LQLYRFCEYLGSEPAGKMATNASPVSASKQIVNDRRRACV